MSDKLSRRTLLQQSAVLGAFAVMGTACNKQQPTPLACTDTNGLSPADLTTRTSLAYVDASIQPGKMCSNCQQFMPSDSPNACGTCKVVKGPINPKGYCNAYTAKPA